MLPKGTLKRKERSDSIRSIGFAEDHRFNVRWLKEACRILKPDGTIWVTGTHHIIFSLGFALQTMRLKLINQITWAKPDPPPNALHTAFTHPKAVVVRPSPREPRVLDDEPCLQLSIGIEAHRKGQRSRCRDRR